MPRTKQTATKRPCPHRSNWPHYDTTWLSSCRRCGARGVFSLGPSNDAPAGVQVEIRAAELEPIWGLRLMSILIDRSEDEIAGGEIHRMNLSGISDGGNYSEAVAAGWLGREMATHDNRETRDSYAWAWDVTRPIAEQDIDDVAMTAWARRDDRIFEQTRHDVAASVARHSGLPGRVPYAEDQIELPVVNSPVLPPLTTEEEVAEIHYATSDEALREGVGIGAVDAMLSDYGLVRLDIETDGETAFGYDPDRGEEFTIDAVGGDTGGEA